MIGTHADICIAEAVAHGLDKRFNLEQAYEGMFQGATQSQNEAGRDDMEDWLSVGYIPYDKNHDGTILFLSLSRNLFWPARHKQGVA